MRNTFRNATSVAFLLSILAGSCFGSATPQVMYGVSPDGTANNPPQVTPPSGTGGATNGGSVQVNTEGLKATYTASVTGFTPVAAATDILNMFGSAGKTIRITRIEVTGTTSAATAAVSDLQVVKRSTVGTLGSAVLTGLTAVPLDSGSAAASATVSTVGTANYGTLGTLIGAVEARKFTCQLGTATATDFPIIPPTVFTWTDHNEQGLVVRGAAQQVALNWNGGTVPAGCSLDISVSWTEE